MSSALLANCFYASIEIIPLLFLLVSWPLLSRLVFSHFESP